MRSLVAAALVAVLLLSGCTGTTSPTTPGQTANLAAAFSFLPATTPTQAPDGFGTEPSILASRDGAIYFTSVLGSATARGDGLWKTTDNGTAWTYLGKADYPFGGGDSDLDEFPGGRLLLTGQWRPAAAPANPVASPYVTGGESASYSTDGGKSWTPSPVAGFLPDADRNWLATHGPQTAWLVYNFGLGGLMVTKTTDGGATWLPPTQVQGTTDSPGGGPNGIAGDAVADPRDGTLYIPYGPGPGGGTVQRLLASTDGGATFVTRVVHTTPKDATSGAIFSTVALDTAGNLYFAWSESVHGQADVTTTPSVAMHVFVAHSEDHGATWSAAVDATPSRVAGAAIDEHTNVFPWVVAGAPGHVAVASYEGNTSLGPDDAATGTTWHPSVSFSTDALAPQPTYTAVQASLEPNHRGPICTGGTGCSSGRTLGDFFEAALDKWGHVVLVYADDTGSAQRNHVAVGQGPSLN
jgi:hypothetical protein